MANQDSESQPKASSPIEFGRLLFKNGVNFKSLIRCGKYYWRIEFDSYQEANLAVDNEIKKKSVYNFSIPEWLITCSIVLRGIPLDISENELIQEISRLNPNIPVRSERLKRRIIQEDKTEFIDSLSVKFTIRARDIPNSILLWNIVNPVGLVFANVSTVVN